MSEALLRELSDEQVAKLERLKDVIRGYGFLALVDRVVVGDGLTFVLRDGTEWTM